MNRWNMISTASLSITFNSWFSLEIIMKAEAANNAYNSFYVYNE